MPNIPSELAAVLADRYRLERELGQGGMAVVYLATDLKHDRRVALKVMRSEMKGVLGPRFAREIRVAARLQHPHICSVYDSGETPDGELWYTMPFVSGESLRDRLTGEPRLPILDAVRIIREAAQGLEYANKQGVIHRDIKPENILLTEDGNTLVADFGIARAVDSSSDPSAGHGGSAHKPATILTEAGHALGTPAYMSPEQRLGETVTAASDVYSLSAVLYEMLAGERPGSANSMSSLLAQMSDPAPRVRLKREEVSPALDEVVRDGLHPDPAKRIASMAALGAALEAAVSGQYRVASSTSSWRRPALLAVAAVAIVAAGLAWYRSRDPAAPEIVTVLPFTLTSPVAPDDSTLAYLTGSIGEDLRRMISHVPGLSASSEAAVANVAGGRLSSAEIVARMGSRIIVQPSAGWRDSSVVLSFQVSRLPAKQSTRVEFSGTPQWVVDHRDSLVAALLAAGGHQIDRELAASLVRWGIATTLAPAYIRYWKYYKAGYDLPQREPNWVPILLGWQDSLIGLDPRFIDAISDKVLNIAGALASPGMLSPAAADSLRREAASLVRRATQIDGTHPLTFRASGYHSLMINDTASALRAFTEAVAAEPVFQTITDLCFLQLTRTRPSQPLPASCVELVRVDSLNPFSLQNVTWLLLESGRRDAALEPAQRLVRLAPNDVSFRLPLIQVLKALGRDDQAMAELRTALGSSPNDMYLLWTMAEAQWTVGLTEEALETSRRIVGLNPSYLPGQLQLSNMLSRMERDDEAIAQARATVALAPDAAVGHWRLATVLWLSGSFDPALEEFRKAAALEKSLQRLKTLADALRLAGKVGDAQGIVERIQLQEQGSPDAAYENGEQLRWLGRHSAAVPEFVRGMGRDTLNAARWNSIGYAEILAGQVDSALVHIRRAMTLDSFNVSVLSNFALIMALKGSNREAAQTSDRMRSRQSLDHDLLAQQIWFHARAGDSARARAMLDTLQQRLQRNGTSTVPLVIALSGVQDTAGARAALRRSVEARDWEWNRYSLDDPMFAMLRGTPEFAEAVRAFRQGGDR